MCQKCTNESHAHDHEEQMFDPNGNWRNWDGKVEIHETWVSHGPAGIIEVNHVTEESPAPSHVDTEWSVYGHLKTGGVFSIADFEYGDHDGAMQLVHGLERIGMQLKEQQKEIERMTECLEQPVGYVNQGVLVALREGEDAGVSAAIARSPNSHHNCAIYAQD